MNPVCVGHFKRDFDSKYRLYLAALGVDPGDELIIEQQNGKLFLRAYSVYLEQYNDYVARSKEAKTYDEASMWINAARNISKYILAKLIAAEKSRVQIPIEIMKEYFHDADWITFQGIGDGFEMIPCNKPKK